MGAATAAGFAGCTSQLPDGIGIGGGDGNGTSGVDTGPDVTELTPADCEPRTIDEDIETDTTWNTEDCPRVALDGNVRVTNGATLTVEPGVEVVGTSGSRLTVRPGCTLVVSGDPENPVWFHGESEAPGYWQGIRIRSNAPNELDNAILQHGGANDWANVYLDGDARASITNVLSERSATSGFIAESGTTISEFTTNEFRENEDYAVSIPTTLVGSIDGESTYAGENATDAVGVFDADVEEDATWPATDAPYRFTGNNHRLNGAAVTVEASASFLFGEGARITVRPGSSLAVEGTADSPVTFEGETETPGYWQGIRVRSNDPANVFDHAVVAHGGANEWANVYLDGNAQASITNSTFRASETSGLVAESGTTISEFATNEFRENEMVAITIPTSLIGSIDGESTYAGENATDAVGVFDADVEEDAAWPATDAPYRFTGNNHRLNGAAVTVEAGASFLFGEGARITVRPGSSLAAEGDEDAEITFEGESADPGYWQGIRVRSNDPANAFDNVVVAHGGANDWANVYLDGNAQASITNSTLRESATWGIYAEDGTTLESSNNVFENNNEGGVRSPGSSG